MSRVIETTAQVALEKMFSAPMGCQFEYTRIKELDRVDIALGFICQEHREMIRSECAAASRP